MGVLEKYKLSLREKTALCSGGSSWSTYEIKEKGIPGIVMTDGTYGVRYCKPGEECIDGVEAMSVVELNLNSDSAQLEKYYRATCFPSPSGFACSWDRVLLEEMARYIGQECGALGVDMLLAPAINIRRDPRGGRGFEYFSEDPVLTAELAECFIKGLQSSGVGACLKHFACNNSEYQRTKMDSIVDPRALREIYLYAFQKIIENTPPMAVMSSYNKLNGEQVSESKTLLTDILRDEWHYDGLVVSDWGGIKDRIAAIKAGGDLEMPRNVVFNRMLEEAVTSGELKSEELDACVERILTFVERASENRNIHHKVADGCLGYRLAVKVATESCVLLKNENHVLPIDASKISRLAVIGDMAITPRYQGGGCAVINPTTISIPYDEIVSICGPSVNVKFCQGYTGSDQTTPELLDQVRREAALADYVIVFAGVKIRDDTEGFNRDHLWLEPAHVQAIRAAAEVNKRVIVVLNNGDAVTMEDFEPLVPGILECFFNGQGGGVAVAKILFGEANPCGKLTTTFPRREEDIPAFLSFPGEFGSHPYQESFFVGYRYYDKRNIQPQYEFGYGLSYTEFRYSDFQVSISPDCESITAHVTIENIGARAGKEIIQFYLEPVEVGYYKDGGIPYEVGDIYTNPDLGTTIQKIIDEGVDGFYSGSVAESIVATANKYGNTMTMEDLQNYEVKVRTPVSGDYRGYTVISSPPSSSGGTSVIEILNILENFDVASYEVNSPEYINLFSEAFKIAFADRAEYIADTDFTDVPLEGLQSKEFAAERASLIELGTTKDYLAGEPYGFQGSNTTHFSIMDKEGNIVSVTQTNNGGSGITAEGTGVLLNGEMADFSTGYDNANSIEAGKRPLSSMSPTIILDEEGNPYAALGSPGSTRIITTMAEVISHLLDHNMDIQEAIDTPRFFCSGAELYMETRIPESVSDELEAMGYTISRTMDYDTYYGGVHGVVKLDSGILRGGADNRRDGKALGYEELFVNAPEEQLGGNWLGSFLM